MELEASTAGTTILNKETEITDLKKKVSELEKDKATLLKERNNARKQFSKITKKMIKDRADTQNYISKRLGEQQDFYLQLIKPDGRLDLVDENTRLKKDNLKLLNGLENWRDESKTYYKN